MGYKTTRQVYEDEGVSKITAIKWAKKHEIKKWGRDYVWSSQDVEKFRHRDKKRGRKFGPQGPKGEKI